MAVGLAGTAVALSFDVRGFHCLVACGTQFSVWRYQQNLKLLIENPEHSHSFFSSKETAFLKTRIYPEARFLFLSNSLIKI